MPMKFKPWHLLLIGLVALAIGRITLGLRIVPYEPAIKAGYPAAKQLTSNGPVPLLLMFGGVMACLFAILWTISYWLQNRLNPRQAR